MQKQQNIVLQMGKLRRLTIYEAPNYSGVQNEYRYLFNMPLVKQVFETTDPVIVGMVNSSDPLLQAASVEGAIYVYLNFLEPNKLINVAAGIEQLKKIVDLLRPVWSGKENEVALLKTAENMKHRKQVLKRIKNENPEADESFWDYLAFRELSINIQ